MLSQFKDALGKPREGLRTIRVLDVSLVDVLGTIAGAYALSWYLDRSFVMITAGLMLLSFPVHKLFGVKTKVTEEPAYLAVLVLPPYPI